MSHVDGPPLSAEARKVLARLPQAEVDHVG